MATSPAFASNPAIGAATVSAANTARDGSGTLVDVLSAGASGTRIDAINIKATATTTTGTVRIFIYNGTTSFLLTEASVLAVTVSATQPAFETALYWPEGLILPPGYKIKASTEKAESFNIFARGGNF